MLCSLNLYAYSNFNDLKRAADSGDCEAQYVLGDYYTGIHDQSDYILALKYLRLAVDNGNAKAQNRIKELTENGYDRWGDYELTPVYDLGILDEAELSNISKAADGGDCCASLILAHSYFNTRDYSNAIKYYERCLNLLTPDKYGYIEDDQMQEPLVIMDATSMLGYCYEHGLGVHKNLLKALAYYELLGGYSESPDASVCAQIKQIINYHNNKVLRETVGDCGAQYYDGFAPGPFNTRAWGKSAVLYLKLGKYTIAKELMPNLEHIKELYDSWDVSGSCVGLLWVAESYYKGLGTNIDYDSAFEIFNFLVTKAKAAWDSTDFESMFPEIYADACYRLYECYAFGHGTSKNPEKAKYFYTQSLRFGSSSALYDDQKRYEMLRN